MHVIISLNYLADSSQHSYVRIVASLLFIYTHYFLQCSKLYWNKGGIEFHNQPFRPTKIRKLDCQFGPHYFKHKKRLTDRTLMQTTRKRSCPATVTIREFEVFPEYGYSSEEIEQMSSYALRKFKLTKLEILRSALAEKQPVRMQVLYHVSLPSESAHTGHKCGMAAGMAQRLHPMISQKIT